MLNVVSNALSIFSKGFIELYLHNSIISDKIIKLFIIFWLFLIILENILKIIQNTKYLGIY